MPRKYPSLRDRILANSAVSTESYYDGVPCRIWAGKTTVNRSGKSYGRINLRHKSGPRKGKVKTEFVHRVVVRELKGRHLTRGMVVRHLCNLTLCVEELHVVGGTQKENVRQCVREGRHVSGVREQRAAA